MAARAAIQDVNEVDDMDELQSIRSVLAVDQTSMPNEELIPFLTQAWGIPGVISFAEGLGGLPIVHMHHPQTGQQVVVYLHGATIAQWLKHDGTATFYDGPNHMYAPGAPLRTGVSVHFPQHREGQLPENGFADRMQWSVVGAGIDNAEVVRELQQRATVQKKAANTRALRERLRAKGLAPAAEEAADGDEAGAASAQALDIPVESDAAPYIMLRLSDNEYTRSIYPHHFNLIYKITLQVRDDPLTAAEWEEVEAWTNQENGVAEVEDYDEELDEGAGDEGAEELAEEPEAVDAPGTSSDEAEAADGEQKTKRKRRTKAEIALAETSAAEADAGTASSDDEEQREPDAVLRNGPPAPAVQIKQQFWVQNADESSDGAPMLFQLGSLARFKTMDQRRCPEWVKILGLGGSRTFEYTADPRYPQLGLFAQDYLNFAGEPVDTTFVDTLGSTVYFSPGNRTHFEFILREGFRDMFVSHPGAEVDPHYRRAAAIGTGYVANSQALGPGGIWHAESVIRFHSRYWRAPIFGDDTMPPLPSPSRRLLEASEEDPEAGLGVQENEDSATA